MRLRRARIGGRGPQVDIDIVDATIVAIAPTGTSPGGDEVIDLDGRPLIAGLWDEHVHVSTWAASTRRLDVRSAASARKVAELVRQHLTTTSGRPAGDRAPVIAVGMRDGLWHEPPDRALLDWAAPGTPVMVVSSDLHSTWSNSALGGLLGIELDHTGLLREARSFAAFNRVAAFVADRADDWVAEALTTVGARGVVGIVDLDFDDAVGAWRRRAASPVRIDAGIYPDDLDAAEARRVRTGTPIKGLARVGPLKVITDGSLGTRTAYCHCNYPDTEACGVLEVPAEQLVALMQRGSRLGLTPAIHAIGDAANALALDAFERTGLRGRIEHAQLLDPGDVARMATLGVTASIQPEHMLDDRELVARYWNSCPQNAFRLRSLVDAGIDVVFGSDAPVTPLDPWLAISAAVNRGRDGELAWQPNEAIDVPTALRLSTRTTVSVGAPADLVALGTDPVPQNLRTMPIDLTLVAGTAIHRRV